MSVGAITLAAMESELPSALRYLAGQQNGVVSRSQAIRAGLSTDMIKFRLRSGRWRLMHRGVYATFTGVPGRRARLWAAVLSAGPGAMLSYHTAAELQGLADKLANPIHVTVPHERHVLVAKGVRLHRSARAVEALQADTYPPRTRLLGPNGAGKTTTVEILEGFRHRDQGTVTVFGQDPAQAGRAWRARIGIVLQLASAGPELTVLEMVGHFAAFYPRPRQPEEAIDLVGLTAKARSRISNLSGGQTRRLDVALGIVGRPELLFLDEPTTGFDPEARRQFWELIKTLRGDGTTIVLTTHYLDEAEALADRIAVIAAGRIVAEGDPGSLGGRPAAAARVSWEMPGGERWSATSAGRRASHCPPGRPRSWLRSRAAGPTRRSAARCSSARPP